MRTYYTKDHEWLKIDGSTGKMGITSYAAKQLGDITFIELPKSGVDVKQGDFLCEIESIKAASDIYAPVSGSITQVNSDLEATPDIVSSNPENEGWIAVIELSNPEETEKLMDENGYRDFLATIE
ncbi:MAG: glycine cleavage system protein GcvH [Elusimicrobiota bacterium]